MNLDQDINEEGEQTNHQEIKSQVERENTVHVNTSQHISIFMKKSQQFSDECNLGFWCEDNEFSCQYNNLHTGYSNNGDDLYIDINNSQNQLDQVEQDRKQDKHLIKRYFPSKIKRRMKFKKQKKRKPRAS